jgi:hypothetical protein
MLGGVDLPVRPASRDDESAGEQAIGVVGLHGEMRLGEATRLSFARNFRSWRYVNGLRANRARHACHRGYRKPDRLAAHGGYYAVKPFAAWRCLSLERRDEMMTYVDAVILDLTEWACRRFQMATGRTNVWLAVQLTNVSIILYFVWAAMSFWDEDATLRLDVGLFCAALLFILTRTILRDPIEFHERFAYARVAKGYRNPRRLRDAVLRTSFLTLTVVLGYPVVFVYLTLHLRIVFLTYSLVLLTTVVLYLLACDPLPPCPGRVWQWLQNGWARVEWRSKGATE